LPQRMVEHVANTRIVAEFLNEHRAVSWVAWAGLEESPYRALADRYLPEGPGAIFTFGVADQGAGGRSAGADFIERLQLVSHLANVGDARTLVIHPGSTTHQQLSDEAMAAGGIAADMVRLSVGLEDVEDILWDLDQALTGDFR
ncbi:MAG: PLP-dependent transferase, partial [Acidimicrobiales bacterium]|nr:PLP-dependent transferase [Acidimicrobiales bacterium]